MGYSPWGCKEPDVTEQLTFGSFRRNSFTALITLCGFIFVGLLEPMATAPTWLEAQTERAVNSWLGAKAWLGAGHVVGAQAQLSAHLPGISTWTQPTSQSTKCEP